MISEKIKAEDEEYVNIKNTFKNVFFVSAYSLKDEATKISEIKGNYEKAKGNFDNVIKLLDG
jgi:hypothetical protein